MKFTHHAVALGAAVALGLLGSTTVALAQDDVPPAEEVTCEEAASKVAELQVRLSTAETDAETKQTAVESEKTELDGLDRTDRNGDEVTATDAERDRLAGILETDPNYDLAQEKLGLIDAILAQVKVVADVQATLDAALKVVADVKADIKVAIDVRTEACEGTPPTDEPDPTPDPDYDCNDFPLPDGRSAQDVLDETPNGDPHNLDYDDDRIACDDADGDYDQIGTPPAGGVDTGGGPA